MVTQPKSRLFAVATLAMLFFAANSILCRMALSESLIDPASFTSLRLLSGALTLLAINIVLNRNKDVKTDCKLTESPIENWLAAAMLFLYAAAFSFAYLYLEAGIGALILFAFVQLTMFVYSYRKEGGASGLEWLGALTATSGLGYLISPGIQAPDLWGAILMAVSGIAWGVYSVLGKTNKEPHLKANCINFRLSLLFVVPFFLLNWPMSHATVEGILLAVLSGGLASGIGYAIWYGVVPHFRATQAGVVQLSVPVLAIIGGFLLMDEMLTARMFIASAVILFGIALTFVGKQLPVEGEQRL